MPLPRKIALIPSFCLWIFVGAADIIRGVWQQGKYDDGTFHTEIRRVEASIQDLHEAIRAGQTDPCEVVQQYI